MRFVVGNDLFKARTHKYIKRTGTPGHYRYWYYDATGNLVADDSKQAMGRLDHVKRLIAARMIGLHSKTDHEIAQETGENVARVQSAKRNMERANRSHASGRTFRSHDYERHHLDEAIGTAEEHPGDVRLLSPESASRIFVNPPAPAAAPARPRRRSRSASEARMMETARRVREEHEQPSDSRLNQGFGTREQKQMADVYGFEWTIPFGDSGHFVNNDPENRIEIRRVDGDRPFEVIRMGSGHTSIESRKFENISEAFQSAVSRSGRAAESTSEVASQPESSISQPTEQEAAAERMRKRRAKRAAAAAAAPSDGLTDEQRELIRKIKEEHNVDLSPAPPAPAPAPEPIEVPTVEPRETAVSSVEYSRTLRESGPDSPNAHEIHDADPTLADADAPIREMIAAQERGENPYLKRAKDIFHNIVGDLKEERKTNAQNMLRALESLGSRVNTWASESGEAMRNLEEKYKEISGRRNFRGAKEDFEKATFHTVEEVAANNSVDPELERMKRGYGAKQFARLKPFLKQSWVNANPGAPPPMPTYGDIKSWTEHGGVKPDWAGTTRLALPKEVHDAAFKGADGKPKHPPGWMPIHLAPVWKYVMAKSVVENKDPYRSTIPTFDRDGRPTLSAQAGSDPAGIVVNAIRKYVQMRGGPDQLVDIPASKLSEVGLTHSDIFKSDDLSDAAIKQLIRQKIVDPVALVPFIKRELRRKTQKSFALVVDPDAVFRPESVVKSELIQKIKQLKKSKGGEGSRGGKIIGHTKSGKPIYESGFDHSSVKDFTKQDHIDAAKMHHKIGGMHFEDYINEEEVANGEERPPKDWAYEAKDKADHHARQADKHERAGGIHWSQRRKI